MKYDGDWLKIYQALETKEKIAYEDLINIETKITCRYVTIIDREYPKSLCNIYRPPFVLFYVGDLAVLNGQKHKLAICGITAPNKRVLMTTKMLTKKILKRKITLIVTSEPGINEYVVKNLGNGSSILILKNLNDYEQMTKQYPNTKFQIIIVEAYENNVNKSQYELYRIMSGLMDGVIIVQSTLDDETHRIVSLAKHDEKEVFCFPAQITVTNKNNGFIKYGEQLVENVDDICGKL
ncbi:DNA-processing protein DprA [Spiroplasma phoeniceum]|uniref:DNA-processing protein DprA n=1 Tax=Spiroplasma phoeniceum TaxID=47835 RepID=UPI0033651492